jgi:hypothetical protein
MAEVQTFAPGFGTGVVITTAAGSAATAVRPGTNGLCLTNTGTVTVYMRTGDSSAVASTADYPVLAGQQVTITRFADFTHVATISPAGAGELHVMGGQGF